MPDSKSHNHPHYLALLDQPLHPTPYSTPPLLLCLASHLLLQRNSSHLLLQRNLSYLRARKNTKRKREKAELDFENTTNEKIKNADEVFIVANTDRDRQRVEGLNHVHGRMIKKEREALLMHKHKNADGSTGQGEFRDEKLKMTAASNKMYKGKFGG